jgi:hypothetical protein
VQPEIDGIISNGENTLSKFCSYACMCIGVCVCNLVSQTNYRMLNAVFAHIQATLFFDKNLPSKIGVQHTHGKLCSF